MYTNATNQKQQQDGVKVIKQFVQYQGNPAQQKQFKNTKHGFF